MNQKAVWNEFDKLIREKFINEKSAIYDVLGTTDAMSEDFWLDSLRKYIDELIVKHRNPYEFKLPHENLLKIAHIASVIFHIETSKDEFLKNKKSWD